MIICEIIVHVLVTVQNLEKYTQVILHYSERLTDISTYILYQAGYVHADPVVSVTATLLHLDIYADRCLPNNPVTDGQTCRIIIKI